MYTLFTSVCIHLLGYRDSRAVSHFSVSHSVYVFYKIEIK